MPKLKFTTQMTDDEFKQDLALLERVGRSTNCLEVGVYEGCTACWLLDNVLTHPDSRYTGVDDFQCNNLLAGTTALANLGQYLHKAQLLRGDSRELLPRLHDAGRSYNLIHVDGGHLFDGCLRDLHWCWKMLLPVGIMMVDDVARDDYGVAKALHYHLALLQPTSYKITHWGYRATIRKMYQ